MRSRSEKLAWELVKVLSRYRPREIEEAIGLLSGSQLFEKPIDLIKAAASAKDIDKEKEAPSSKNVKLSEAAIEANDKLGEIFDGLEASDKAIIRDLAEGVVSSRYLKTSGILREYAARLNIALPKKMPSRSTIALRIVEEILRLEHAQRSTFIEAAKTMSEDVSSLQRWSALIVR